MLHAHDTRRLNRLRWTAFLLVAVAFVLSFFHRIAPVSIAPELQQAFNASGAELGFLAASYFYVYTVMQIPTGVLVDTLGVRTVVAVGGLVAGIGSMVFGGAETLAGAWFGRFLVGFGVSFTFLACLKINALWFSEKYFATLAGLLMILGNLGAVLAAAPLVWVLQFYSWREVFVAIGWFSVALALVSAFAIWDSPRAAGLPSPREREGGVAHAPHQGPWWRGLAEVFNNRALWPGFVLIVGTAGAYFSFAGLWAVPFLHDVYQLPKAVAARYALTLLLAFAIGAFAIGLISDRLKKRKPAMLVSFLVYLGAWFVLWTQPPFSSVGFYLLFALFGLGAAGFTLTWTVAKEVSRPALSGMSTGVVNTGAFLGAALLQPLVGAMMDATWDGKMHEGARLYSAHDYRNGLGLLLVAATAGFAAAFFVRETHARQYQS
jgi:sugar phosphate permease